jgi:hypothetical protein
MCECHVEWAPSLYGVARPQATARGDNCKYIEYQLRRTDKGRSSSLMVGKKANSPLDERYEAFRTVKILVELF